MEGGTEGGMEGGMEGHTVGGIWMTSGMIYRSLRSIYRWTNFLDSVDPSYPRY